MKITTWNALHGMATSPEAVTFPDALAGIDTDLIALQELDYNLKRSGNIAQIEIAAQAIRASDWAFAPTVIGTPGENPRHLRKHEHGIVTSMTRLHRNERSSYGIGIASKVPVKSWHRCELGRSRIGLPLLIPGEDGSGKVRARFIYVRDENRAALAAVLENGWIVVNTHLSFVPVVNLYQLIKVKRFARSLALEHGGAPIILGDFNMIGGLPKFFTGWSSLVIKKSYPRWKPSIQFDYILAPRLYKKRFASRDVDGAGVSDHIPLAVEVDTFI